MTVVRSFVAVPLPPHVQSRIFDAAGEMAGMLPGVRWVRKVENLHVTVKFLGPTPEDRLAALGHALETELAAVPRFRLDLHRMGAFPSARHASVLWAWADDAGGGLAAETGAVESSAERFGYPRESRPMTGHVTVGRSKRGGVNAGAALDAFVDREFGSVTVDEIHVYESRLGRGPDNGGSTYVLRHRAA
jgi:2'-5' RNA ligase